MDMFEKAVIARARDALQILQPSAEGGASARARAFVEMARGLASGRSHHAAFATLAGHDNELVANCAKSVANDAAEWGTDAAALASAFVASIAERSILDQVKRYARPIPRNLRSAMSATGFTGNLTAENEPKIVKTLQLSLDEGSTIKSTAVLIMSAELMRATGDTGRTLFETELESAIIRASNEGFLGAIANTAATSIATSNDWLVDLRAGLRAAEPSDAYVVVLPPAGAIDLATRVENKGSGVRGGDFVSGISLVSVDSETRMTVIPASRLSLRDLGLELRGAGEASVSLADSPTSPSELINLWQCGLRGLLAERSFDLILNGTVPVYVE